MNTSSFLRFFHFRTRRALGRLARKSASVITITAMIASSFAPLAVVPASAIAATTGDVVINEFSSDNGSSDWVELYNTTASDIDLSSWTLKDIAGNSFTLSASSIPAHGFVTADASNKLNDDGDEIILADGTATTINAVAYGSASTSTIDYDYAPTPATSQSAYRTTDGGSTWGLTDTPTKDASNVVAARDTTAPTEPVATPNHGFYSVAQTVTLTSRDNSGAEPSIYYTINNGALSAANGKTIGTLYTGPISVSSAESIYAIAYDAAGNASPVLESTYGFISPSATPTVVTVTPSDLNQWNLYDDQADAVQSDTADHGFVSGPGTPVAGTGSVHLTKTTTDKYGIATTQFAGTALSDITSLSYSTYRASGDPAQAASLGFDVDSDTTDGDTSYQGRLTYEPYFTQTVDTGTWQTWNTLDDTAGSGTGNWWFSHSKLSGGATSLCTQSNPCTWSELLTDYPHAAISGRLILRTNGADGQAFDGNVDNFTIGTSTGATTYDFEPDAPKSVLNAENFNTVNDSTYKGVSVGFDAKDFGTVSAVTVDMMRADGTHAIKHGTQDLFNLIDGNTAPYQFTAPFVIEAGTYVPATDSYWTSDPAAWSTFTTPKSVTITVTGTNGTESVTNSNFSQGAPSWPTYASLLSPAACNSSTFDGDTLGSVNGQDGWSATGPYDQAIVANVYGFTSFGCNALRISDQKTSGSFGDWVFSAPAAAPAGETASGATMNHFEAQFDIASTMLDEQPGMELSVSPTDANGSRMSYLRFVDESDGIHVFFDDATDPTSGQAAVWNETEIAGGSGIIPALSRLTAHTVKFVMDFNDGVGNDVVKIDIDGTLVHTGGSWEDYYRNDPEQAGNGNTLPSIDRLIFQARGTANPADAGNGFLFDNVSVATSFVVPTPDTPTGLYAKFQNDAQNIADGTTLNKIASTTGNNLLLGWKVPTIAVAGYRILTTYPDGSTKLSYQGANNWSWIASGEAFGSQQGKYTFQVEAVNRNNVVSPLSAPFTLSYDTHGPTAHFDPAPAKYVNSDFSVAGEASDNVALKAVLFDVRDPSVTHGNSWVAGCTSGSLSTVTSADSKNATTSCMINTKSLTEGHTYTLRIHASDNAGYGGGAQQDLIIDRTRPNGSITAPVNSSTQTGTFTITGTATDNLSGVDHVNVYVTKLNNGTFGGYVVNNQPATWDAASGTFSYDVSGLADGTYTIKADIFDKAGNNHFAGSSPTITVQNVVIPAIPTAPLLLTPSDGAATSTNDFYFTWADSIGKAPLSYVFHSSMNPAETGGVLTTGLWTSGTLTTPSIHSTGAPDGTWYWQVRATDADGNQSDWSSIWSMTIDTHAPAMPTITSPADGSATTTAGWQQISWTDSSDSGTPVTYDYEASLDGVTNADGSFASTIATVNDITNTTLATPGTPAGTYYLHVKAIDAAGNESDWSPVVKVTVDNSGTGGTTPTATTTANIVLRPGDLVATAVSDPSKWFYFNDASVAGGIDNNLEGFISGPGAAPAGNGSAHFGQSAGKSEILGTDGFVGNSLADLTSLSYSTYGESGDVALTPMLVMDIATTSTATGQGRLVYTPSGAALGSWQTWNPLTSAAGWWFTDATLETDSGCTAASTCSWSTIIAAYPGLTINGLAGFKVDNSIGSSYIGDVDNLTFETSGMNPTETTVDFEPDSSTNTTITNASDLSANASTAGDPVTVEWKVTDDAGATVTSGTVDVSVNGGAGCSAPVADGACDIPSSLTSTAGSITIAATYQPAAGYDQSSSAQVVHPIDAASTPSVSIVGGGGIFGLLSLLGDLNHDGHVNFLDFALLMAAIGGNGGSADLNHDGVVNIDDLNLLMAHWTN
ncbi:MAG TPA: lamin tail domain-containing protein [Candidatus Paceibacterota bacterium]|nr:lamin tail domain-containing protein [Candidatus Paceibacterota bacterium]